MATDMPPFDPEWLAVEQMIGGRMTLPAEPVDDSRARFDGVFKSIAPLIPPPTTAVIASDVLIPERDQRVRIYKPNGAAGLLPVGLYIHSGGWYGGSIENEDFMSRNIVENTQIILYSPDYRLAPENPYPAGLDDVCAAYEFMYKTAAEHGGDPTKKFVMGGSAGGNLTAAVGLKYATHGDLQAKGLCIFVPAACEPSVLPEEYRVRYTPELYVDAPMVGNDISLTSIFPATEWLNAPATDPLYSVLLHPNIKHLPSCYIAACTKDPTHQETLFFYEECKKKGVEADLVEWVGMPHFFWAVPSMKKTQEFMSVWNHKLKSMITTV